MTANRRQLLQLGFAASVLPTVVRAVPAEHEVSAVAAELYTVLYDTRFPASRAFADRAAALGLPVEATCGDITRFWYDDLYHRWKGGAAPIAGMTAHGALFCLERLAWDQRMRVVLRGEHAASPGGGIVHRLEGPEVLLPVAAAAVAAPEWAPRLAGVIAACPRERVRQGSTMAVAGDASALPLAETLYTWVIAPVARS